MKHLILAVAAATAFGGFAGEEQEKSLEAALPRIFARSVEHYRAIDAKATPLMKGEDGKDLFPNSWDAKTGQLAMRSIFNWTSGHFPGTIWYLYEGTQDAALKDMAVKWTERLAPNSTADTNHDLGFIMYCSFGNARRLMKTDRYDALLIETAETLSKRYSPALGLIRSWGKRDEKKNFLVSPDNLMNLELMEAATRISKNPEFDRIARSHATITARHHFRADGGCYHVLDYDQETKRVKEVKRGQGASVETAWSRGQSWAIYGYTMMFRETKDPLFLEMAMKCADFAINNPNMPEDGVPYWDYGAPGEERDTSAGSILASALFELSTLAPAEKGPAYRAFAVKALASLASPAYFAAAGENGDFLLMHGVGHKPGGSQIDTPLVYGDYYFAEALIRFRRLRTSGSL